MKNIKIWFSGFSGRFNPYENFITEVLRKKYRVEITKNADYLFYSVLSSDYLQFDCVRIYFTPENIVPDFNICDYAIGFHYISFEDRYVRYPLYFVESFKAYEMDDYSSDLNRAINKHKNSRASIENKVDFCSFVYSNAEAAKCREMMLEKLSKYKRVNSGGRYLNNIGSPVKNKYEFQKKHKFVIAFENTSTPGYTTEKIVHAFSAGAVPIYWGNTEITKEFNPGSFVNCHEYGLTEKGELDAIDAIVEEVKRIDQDDIAYASMLSTPAFAQDNYVTERQKALEEFLFHIFDQEPNLAFRRNRFYWGERYERKQRIGNKVYWICRKAIPVRDWLRNKVNRWIGNNTSRC